MTGAVYASKFTLPSGLSPVLLDVSAQIGCATPWKSAEVVTLDYGGGRYDIRIAGIDVPKQEPFATKAKQFVANLVFGKNVRIRFQGRTPKGEMLGRLDTDDTVIGIKEAAVELVRAGLARVQKDYDGELSKAESEAREAKRGIWALAQPR